MMNRRGYGALGFVLLYLLLIFMWPFVFAPMLNQAGEDAVANGAVGIEAFLWSNLNLWLFLIFVVVAIVYLRLGGDT